MTPHFNLTTVHASVLVSVLASVLLLTAHEPQ